MQRVILLGASNLTLGLPCVLDALSSGLTGPIEVFAAIGHGRSYGIWSQLLGRGLPGITDCGLWMALRDAELQPDRTLAVVTDIGNDLLYGIEVPQIIAWVETCCRNLAEQNAAIALTLLPMDSVRRLSAWRYHLAKTLLFPGHGRIGWPEMRGRIGNLNERLRTLGSRYGANLFEPPGQWYGLDPIHIRRRHRPEAWREILSLCDPEECDPDECNPDECNPDECNPEETVFENCCPSLRFRLRCWRARPAEWRLFGRSRTTRQPVFHADRLTLSLY